MHSGGGAKLNSKKIVIVLFGLAFNYKLNLHTW